MKKKFFAVCIMGMTVCASASAQTIKDNIDKAHNSKDAKDKSAKADVIILPKTISDKVPAKMVPMKTESKKPVASGNKTKLKEGKHKHKRKTSS